MFEQNWTIYMSALYYQIVSDRTVENKKPNKQTY